LIGIARRKKT